MKRPLFCLLAAHLLSFSGCSLADQSESMPPTVQMAPPVLPELWVIDLDRAAKSEQTLALTLQGLLAKQAPKIWIAGSGMNAVILDRLIQNGTRVHYMASVWELLRQFHGEVQGAILYTLGDDSINVATSLCGPMQSVAIEASILDRAKAEGLKVLFDARGYDEQRAFAEFKDQYARGIAVEQSEEKNAYLRDFAVMKNAFTFYGLSALSTSKVVSELGSGTIVFGWGSDELAWVQAISQGGGVGVPADWSRNLSVLSQLPVPISSRPHRYPEPVKDGERIVAFVMSDGDNIQWMAGEFVTDTGFWASPHRSTFPMTWEMAPILSEVAPLALDHFYRTASRGQHLDDFVTGPSGAGYSFPNHVPDRASAAKQTATLLQKSDLQVVTILNEGGDLTQADELLSQPEVLGVLYKDYAPYNLRKGAIHWHHGKPAVAYRFLLWQGQLPDSPIGVADSIARMPQAPDANSYALINVHAWSYKDLGGPMEAVRQTIDRLPPGTRVVTAEQLIILLRNAFGSKVPPTTLASR